MNPKDLLERIQLGEDSTLELKEARLAGHRIVSPHRDSLANELAAFANSGGGICVIGVEDQTRAITGIPPEHLDSMEKLAAEVCNDSIVPPVFASIHKVALPYQDASQRIVLVIEVPRSIFVHRSPQGFLYRVGSSKRSMTPEYFARMQRLRSQSAVVSFDEETVSRASLADLDQTLVNRFRSSRSDQSVESFLHKLAIARQDSAKCWYPTVTGVLMCTADPTLWLRHAFVQAVAYRGTEARPASQDDVYQIDAADITGPADRQILDATHFVFKNMRVEATKHVGRRDTPQYSISAVFEAITNAVAHRDYSMHGSHIRLRLFSDRLELCVPGSLVNTMDTESLPHRQVARNPALVSLLAGLPLPANLKWLPTTRTTFMDRRGEGVKLLLDESEALSGRLPEYRMIDDSELILTVYAASASSRPPDSPNR
ncbi:MAG: putative DNA binding domain-containing protein [Polyangiaceae bacterium]|nr:putative DNA binding domain-containing protein [Polyangiaceae bacterium]